MSIGTAEPCRPRKECRAWEMCRWHVRASRGGGFVDVGVGGCWICWRWMYDQGGERRVRVLRIVGLLVVVVVIVDEEIWEWVRFWALVWL